MARASKGLLVTPSVNANFSAERREKWLNDAKSNFVSLSEANKRYYAVILETLWPIGHGIPGPVISQNDLRKAIDDYRCDRGEPAYKDVFRRVRELQGEEGFTTIIKEGVRYQLQSLVNTGKREPRVKPSAALWRKIQEEADHKCAHCGQQKPDVRLSPDHRQPRSRGGSNDLENWQPLCEQCNNLKSSSCQGCILNCMTCSWAFPEFYKAIQIADDNRELIRRESEKKSIHQSELANMIIRNYFNKD